MAKKYRLAFRRRAANVFGRCLLRVGLGPRYTYLVSVRGRHTGRLHSTPVTLVEEGSRR